MFFARHSDTTGSPGSSQAYKSSYEYRRVRSRVFLLIFFAEGCREGSSVILHRALNMSLLAAPQLRFPSPSLRGQGRTSAASRLSEHRAGAVSGLPVAAGSVRLRGDAPIPRPRALPKNRGVGGVRFLGLSNRGSSARCAAFPTPGPELMQPEAVFNLENVAIFPFWLMMIALPDNKVTKALMGSYAVPILLGCVYVYLTWFSFSDPRILDAFSTGGGPRRRRWRNARRTSRAEAKVSRSTRSSLKSRNAEVESAAAMFRPFNR